MSDIYVSSFHTAWYNDFNATHRKNPWKSKPNAELRAELGRRGLPDDGQKPDLVERIRPDND